MDPLEALLEVTYSPVMGDYLTYKRNRAFDSNGVYPDENYAREIQQLHLVFIFFLFFGLVFLPRVPEGLHTPSTGRLMKYMIIVTLLFKKNHERLGFEVHYWLVEAES